MRVVLTLVALVLIAVMTTALVGPYFIDWSQHRAALEKELSVALGRPVIVNGPIKAALLPTPYLKLVDVAVGGSDGAEFSSQEAKLELSLAPLVRGEIRFADAVFERPRIVLKRRADGALAAPLLDLKAAPDTIGLDTIALHDGSIVIAGAAGAPPIVVDGLDAEAQADSLRGPFQGKGRAGGPDGQPVTFHFASGAMKGDSLPIKFAADLGAGGLRAEFDGALQLGAGNLGYSGGAIFSGGAAPTAWRVAGDLAANFDAAKLQKLEARLGEEPRALTLQGSAEAHFGAEPRLSLTLGGKELNVDAFLRLKDEDKAPPERAYQRLAALFSSAGFERGPPLAVALKIDVPGIILGGDSLSDVALDASASRGAPIALSAQALAPGQTRLAASGEIELGPGGHFKGALDMRASDLDHLRDWLSQGDDGLHERLVAISTALPYRDAALAADVDLSATSVVARNMTLGLARSTLKGDAVFTRAVGDDRNRLYLDLRTDSLDLDALPNFAAGGDFLRDVDLSLALNAGALKIERLGEGDVESGSLDLKLAKNRDDVTLDRLSIAGLGGATIEADGAVKPSERWLNVTVDAERLRDFALLLRRVAPGAPAQALLDRAGALSPAKLTFNARASGGPIEGIFAPDTLAIRGVAGATRIAAKIDRSAGAGKLLTTASLDAPEASTLLRQLGLQAPPATGLGRGAITLRAEGDWSQGFEGEVNASLAGSDLTWHGHALREDTTASGAVTLKSANVLPLLAAFGVVAAEARASAGADIAADMNWKGGQLRLSGLKGNVVGSILSGDLVYQTIARPADVPTTASATPADPPSQLQGALTIDHLSLGALASLALGPPQPIKPGEVWSAGQFAPVLANPPPTDVTLSIASLDLMSNLPAHNANIRLKIGPGAVTLDDVALRAADGSISGHATLRRDGATAALAGQIAFDSIAVESAGLNAKLAGALDFAATGQNAAALVAGLAGAGHLQLTGVELSRLDPDALTRVVAAAQAQGFDIENVDLNHRLSTELDRKPTKIADQTAQAAISAGVLRAGPFDAVHPSGDAKVQAGFDLRSLGLEIHEAISEKDAPKKFWSGPPPAIAVVLKGRLGALNRETDSASLANGLEAQAIARESERIAEFEADIRERAAFNRKLKAFRFLRQRELELQAYAADEARLKSDAERRRVEDELLKASDDARRAEQARIAEEARKAEEDRKAEEEARKLLAPPPPPSPGPNPIAAPADIAPTALQPPRPAPQRTLDPTGIY